MDDDAEETTAPDNDGDITPNYLDIDSDNDGIPDVVEGGDGDLDTNGDGQINVGDEGFADEDGDGMDDDAESTPVTHTDGCLLYTSPSPRDLSTSRMPSSA